MLGTRIEPILHKLRWEKSITVLVVLPFELQSPDQQQHQVPAAAHQQQGGVEAACHQQESNATNVQQQQGHREQQCQQQQLGRGSKSSEHLQQGAGLQDQGMPCDHSVRGMELYPEVVDMMEVWRQEQENDMELHPDMLQGADIARRVLDGEVKPLDLHPEIRQAMERAQQVDEEGAELHPVLQGMDTARRVLGAGEGKHWWRDASGAWQPARQAAAGSRPAAAAAPAPQPAPTAGQPSAAATHQPPAAAAADEPPAVTPPSAALKRRRPRSSARGVSSSSKKVRKISTSCVTCVICKELLVATHTLGCGHMFCGPCLAQWLEVQQQPSCPTCRATVTGRCHGGVTTRWCPCIEATQLYVPACMV